MAHFADAQAQLRQAIRLIFTGDAEALASLIDGCPEVVSERDDMLNGSTALHIAVGEDMLECVQALLARGAAVDERDGEGRTPLHQAVECMAIDAIEVLMREGADAGAESSSGASPLSLATTGFDGTEDAEEPEDEESDDEDGPTAPPLPRRNRLVCRLLGAADDASAELDPRAWALPTMDAHDFECAFAAVAPHDLVYGARVQLIVTAAADDDDQSSYDDEDDEDDNEDISECVEVELIERSPDGRWRCWLTETPRQINYKAPQLMLVRGREIVVDSHAVPAAAPGAFLGAVSEGAVEDVDAALGDLAVD